MKSDKTYRDQKGLFELGNIKYKQCNELKKKFNFRDLPVSNRQAWLTQLLRSLHSNHKVPSSIHGSAEI